MDSRKQRQPRSWRRIEVPIIDPTNDLGIFRARHSALLVPNQPTIPLADVLPAPGATAYRIGKTGRFIECRLDNGETKVPPGSLVISGSIKAGDSGGPILNENGQLIGVSTHSIRREGDSPLDGEKDYLSMGPNIFTIRDFLRKHRLLRD